MCFSACIVVKLQKLIRGNLQLKMTRNNLHASSFDDKKKSDPTNRIIIGNNGGDHLVRIIYLVNPMIVDADEIAEESRGDID